MKKIINKNKIFGFIIGLIVCGVTVYAVSNAAKDITFKASNTNWTVGNVADALDSLYISRTNNDFSTTEKVIGKWIDGKPLYQKTLELDINNTDKQSIAHNISNVDIIYIDLGNSYIYRSNSSDKSSFTSLSLGVSNNSLVGSYLAYIQTVNRTNVVIRAGSSIDFNKAIVTLKYTKTTDQATNN